MNPFHSLSEVIPGFDALIGDSLQLVNKLNNDHRSALLHIRGGYGSGKTLLASALALGSAAQLDGNVAYLLTEQLPIELYAQLHRVGVNVEAVARLRASIIEEDLAARPEEIPNVVALLRTKTKIAVLVVDALDGTRWSHLNRAVADGLAKFSAEEGLLTIVTEEKGRALHAIKNLMAEKGPCAWVNTATVQRSRALADAMKAWSWDIEEDVSDDFGTRDGDVVGITFSGEKAGEDLALFEALAPFVESGSYIEMHGEDGTQWRWVFTVEKTCVEKTAKVSWD